MSAPGRPRWATIWRRVDPVEIAAVFDAADETATPPRRLHGPHLGLTTGPLATRRTTRAPAPAPRIRPPDLEARSIGLELYGQRAAVPWPYAERSALGSADAAATGILASYTVPDTAGAARALVRVNRSATAGALVVAVELLRAGRTYALATLTNADLDTAAPVTLLRGDTLQIRIATAGTGGVTVTAALSIEERI